MCCSRRKCILTFQSAFVSRKDVALQTKAHWHYLEIRKWHFGISMNKIDLITTTFLAISRVLHISMLILERNCCKWHSFFTDQMDSRHTLRFLLWHWHWSITTGTGIGHSGSGSRSVPSGQMSEIKLHCNKLNFSQHENFSCNAVIN